MSGKFRPKSVRNNNFTTASHRYWLAFQGIHIGAYANRNTDYDMRPSIDGSTPPPPPPKPYDMGTRFAPPPPIEERVMQVKSGFDAEFDRANRYGGIRITDVKREYMGFRDAWVSDRHRTWGKDAPMVDIDFLIVNYNHCRVTAMIEYKCGIRDDGIATAPPDFTRANYRTLIDMADRLQVPFFAVYYDRAKVTFTAYPANGWAKRLTAISKTYSEMEWVQRIYFLSGRELPDALRNTLSTNK